jgi:hypothetical protein
MAAFAGDPQVTSGKMMASVGLKVNGKIFAMVYAFERNEAAKLTAESARSGR